jgi:hypothetical protein
MAMSRTRTVFGATITGLALLATSSATLADHIPNHEDCDQTFPMPIPGAEHCCGDGSILWVTMIGPIDDYVIINTTFEITYVSDGATPASDIQLHGTAMVDGGFAEFIVTGADLGFGSGPGTFTGTYETDALNGVADESFFFPPYSIVDLQIDAVTGGIQGSSYFEDSFITCDVVPAPPCEPPAVCEADLDGDGAVNAADLAQLLGNWGPCEDCPADFNGDGVIDATDLAQLLGSWGPC